MEEKQNLAQIITHRKQKCYLKERGEQRRKYHISELVTVTVLTEERVIHKSSTWLHDCYILVLLWPRLSEPKMTQILTHTLINFLVQPVDDTRKALSNFLFKATFQKCQVDNKVSSVSKMTTDILNKSYQRQLKHELFELKLHPNTQMANSCFLFNKEKEKAWFTTNPLFFII